MAWTEDSESFRVGEHHRLRRARAQAAARLRGRRACPRWLVVLLFVASSCASPSPSTDGADGSAEPDSSVADGATSEGADTLVADVQTADVLMVDVQPTDAGTVDVGTADVGTDVQTADVGTADVGTADVQTADVQTADVQASRDACVIDDAGMAGTGCCANEAGVGPAQHRGEPPT